MRAKLWGTRGSIPAPHTPAEIGKRIRENIARFLEAGYKSPAEIDTYMNSVAPEFGTGFGSNTSCVEVKTASTQMIIDSGSGIRGCGYEMMAGPCGKGQGEAHIFMTHFHWDHVIGLPFFTPIYVPGNKIHFYSVHADLADRVKSMFTKPFFPVPFDQLRSKIEFHRLDPRKPYQHGDMVVTPYMLDHPDPCWGFRVEGDGKALAYCVDTECTRSTPEELGPDLPMYKNADLMIFDSQYTLQEAIERVNWGHSAATIGLDLAFHAKIKKIIFTHHEPASSDPRIAAAREEARKYYESQKKIHAQNKIPFHEVEWLYAIEGMSVDI